MGWTDTNSISKKQNNFPLYHLKLPSFYENVFEKLSKVHINSLTQRKTLLGQTAAHKLHNQPQAGISNSSRSTVWPSKAQKTRCTLETQHRRRDTPATGLTIKVKFDNSNTGGKNERKKIVISFSFNSIKNDLFITK